MSDDDRPLPPRYFLDPSARIEDGLVVIVGAGAHRLSRVMRARRGDALELVDTARGVLLGAEVSEVRADAIRCRVAARRPLQRPSPPRIVLSAALIRPRRFDLIVEKATELGAHVLRPFRSERSQMRGAGESRVERWRRIAVEAAEQSRRDDLPELCEAVDFADLVARAAGPGALRLIASPTEAERRVAAAIQASAAESIEVLIGPEGGFTADESELANAHGWTPVTLGPRTVRAETAAIVTVAQIVDALR